MLASLGCEQATLQAQTAAPPGPGSADGLIPGRSDRSEGQPPTFDCGAMGLPAVCLHACGAPTGN